MSPTTTLIPIRTPEDFPIEGARIRWQCLAGNTIEELRRLKQMTDTFGMRYAWEHFSGSDSETAFPYDKIEHLRQVAETAGYDMRPLIEASNLEFWEQYYRDAREWGSKPAFTR